MTSFQEDSDRIVNAMKQAIEEGVLHTTSPTSSINIPKPSNWTCYMFGYRSGGNGIVYVPQEGRVPNRFVRWMMRICFDCYWEKAK